MFSNIGQKIKSLASFFTFIGIVISLIVGIIICVVVGDSVLVIIGLLVIIIGSLMSWILSLTLYGFGELIDSTTKIKKYLYKDTEQNNLSSLNFENLQRLRGKGLITKDEYLNKLEEYYERKK